MGFAGRITLPKQLSSNYPVMTIILRKWGSKHTVILLIQKYFGQALGVRRLFYSAINKNVKFKISLIASFWTYLFPRHKKLIFDIHNSIFMIIYFLCSYTEPKTKTKLKPSGFRPLKHKLSPLLLHKPVKYLSKSL